MYIYMCTILAYLRDSRLYETSCHTHLWTIWDAATTNVLSPDILPVEDLRNMLRNIESELPSAMHLPISSDKSLHFYRYLNTHVLIADRQFLLLIDMSIQNRAQQLKIYEIFSLPVPHNNLSDKYKVIYKYIGVTYDETKAVGISYLQYRACQHASGQFCRINVPFEPSQTCHYVLSTYVLKLLGNKGTVLFIIISYAMYICTCCC